MITYMSEALLGDRFYQYTSIATCSL
jgi:hypothetical protein